MIRLEPKLTTNCLVSLFVEVRPLMSRQVSITWPTIGGLPTAAEFTLPGIWGTVGLTSSWRYPVKAGRPSRSLAVQDSLYSCSPDKSFQHLACAGENKSYTIAEVVLVDVLPAGTVRTLVDLNPEFANLQLGAITRLEGVNRYGDRWWAHLVKPLNYEPGKKYPLIVTTYRTREFLRGASGDENPIHVYAANGFAVLSFDYGRREYDNKPGDFQRYLSWYESMDASIAMAIQKASEMGVVDTTRVGLTGYSRGTEIVAYEITHTKLFRAVSGAAGLIVRTFITWHGDSSRTAFRGKVWEGGLKENPG